MKKDISIIWGCNDFSAHLFEQLKTSNVNMIGFIDKFIKSTFCDKPVYIPHEFKKQKEK